MKIQWLGHSCFYITSNGGVRILTDPFDPKVGYPTPSVRADIVTASHQHSDHNYTKEVQGPFTLIDKPGSYTEHGIAIMGVHTFHDTQGGKQRGENIIFRFTIDGLNVVHCGDLGHVLAPEQAQALGRVDVLLLPVGGHYTIDSKQALQVMEQLRPTLTVPMHFKTSSINFPIASVEDFLKITGGGRRLGTESIQVNKEDLKDMAGVVVLEFPR